MLPFVFKIPVLKSTIGRSMEPEGSIGSRRMGLPCASSPQIEEFDLVVAASGRDNLETFRLRELNYKS